MADAGDDIVGADEFQSSGLQVARKQVTQSPSGRDDVVLGIDVRNTVGLI